MRKLLPILVILLAGCTARYNGVPTQYHEKLDVAISNAGENEDQLLEALQKAPTDQKEGMAFLISYMPQRDLTTLTSHFLLEQVNLAYQAQTQYPWARQIPKDLFLNDVLPYVSLNETRENWRADFIKRFGALVTDCKTIDEAILAVNKNVRDAVMVDYNTKRERPDQSPFESIRQGMASCSGLSILLVDAFRAVGIPARVAGTPNWHDKRGNHNWVEVWKDGKWYFTEFYYDQLDHAWFLADAGKANAEETEYAIYASSFKPTATSFPLVWDEDIKYVYAENVTNRYVDIYKKRIKAMQTSGNHVLVRVTMYGEEKAKPSSADRIATNVDLFCGTKQMGGGRTPEPTHDMNRELEFLVPMDQTYTFKYADRNGRLKEVNQEVKDKDIRLALYL
ncbi:MAG: transglutaminase-like domain-containing protein [Marinifilaceae bacterium]